MVNCLPQEDCWEVKEPLIYRVAPGRNLKRWKLIQEGSKHPCARGLSKEEAVKLAARRVQQATRPAIVLIHKTRYIVEQSLRFEPL
jgi:hypothetical protein